MSRHRKISLNAYLMHINLLKRRYLDLNLNFNFNLEHRLIINVSVRVKKENKRNEWIRISINCKKKQKLKIDFAFDSNLSQLEASTYLHCRVNRLGGKTVKS